MKNIKILLITLLIFNSQNNLLAMNQIDMDLIRAIKQEKIELVSQLINNGANPNAKDRNGLTILMHAAKSKNSSPEIIKMLVNFGANINDKDRNGLTTLMHAAQSENQNPEVIIMLVNFGADINDEDHSGTTPLMYATISENTSPEVIRMLINFGANINDNDHSGATPLIWGIESENPKPEIIKILIDFGSNLNYKDPQGDTATNIARAYAILIQENENLTSWYLNFHGSYSYQFHLLFKEEIYKNIRLPHNINVHSTILKARIPYYDLGKLINVIKQESPDDATEFITWIYTGLIPKENPEIIKNICNQLNINFDDMNTVSGFKRDMRNLYNSRITTGDFTIIVDGQKILVHKDIMSARSDLYKNMFLSVSDESNSVTDRSGLSPYAFNALIEFIYTGKILYLTQDIINEFIDNNVEEYFQLPQDSIKKILEIKIRNTVNNEIKKFQTNRKSIKIILPYLNLRKLELRFLLEKISLNTNIENLNLDLGSNKIDSTLLQKLIDAIKKNRRLKTLELSLYENNIDDIGAKKIAHMIANSNLKSIYINLNNNPITIIGIEEILEAFEQNSKIEKMDLKIYKRNIGNEEEEKRINERIENINKRTGRQFNITIAQEDAYTDDDY